MTYNNFRIIVIMRTIDPKITFNGGGTYVTGTIYMLKI